jgi:hypothetical protein
MNTEPKPPTHKEIEEFLDKYRKRGKIVTDLLEKLAPEITEITKSGFGWQLIKDDVARCVEMTEKTIKGEATDLERAEARYLMFERIPTVTKKMTQWLIGIEMIKSGEMK